MISLNISNKLCISAGNVINQASSKLHDNKLLDDVETLSYILDDTNQTNEDPSHQLAVLLKNLKKIEQAFELTKSIMRQKENSKVWSLNIFHFWHQFLFNSWIGDLNIFQ